MEDKGVIRSFVEKARLKVKEERESHIFRIEWGKKEKEEESF
jgi:hypothetical protein